MFKYIVILLVVNALLDGTGITSKNNVVMDIHAPAEIVAGSTVDVDIELHKGDLSGFARFQQQLPNGVTASPVLPADMNFTFEDNTVKMIWLNLPREEIITVRYRLHINERLSGNLDLNGTFSYIENNQRKYAEATSTLMAVNSPPDIDKRLIVDVAEADRKLPSPPPSLKQLDNVMAIRQDPVADDNGYIVNILVNKGDNNHFAKIEEIIPDGFTAFEMENRGGLFSFSEQRVRIIWRNLPAESSFITSYRLVPDDTRTEVPQLSGEFAFMHNEITNSRKIVQRDTELPSIDETNRNQLLASISPLETYGLPPGNRHESTPSTSSATPQRTLQNTSRPLKAEEGVYYRVQIAAGQRPVNIEQYFRQRNITDDVHSEIHEGWIKYSVGSYYDYKSARDHRVNIRNATSINDAFVTAYNNGSRITVQEALMFANHQWYR